MAQVVPPNSGKLASSILQTPPPLDNTLGALLIGTLCTSVLCGLSVHQTYRYFRIYGSDPQLLKVMVVTLCVLDAAHEMMAIHLSYFYLITNYFNPIRLLSGVWSLRLIVTVTGLTATITHLFFARRVFILSGGQRFYPFCAVILIVAELGFCITATVAIFVDVTFARFQEHSSWIIYTALGLRVVTDFILTISLIFFLQRSRTGFKSTDTMIDVLILYAINTGLVTRQVPVCACVSMAIVLQLPSISLFSLAAAITAFVLPDTLIYIAIYIVSSNMYSSSVIAV
ncbi:hypothetical protein LXA43DRAFT_1100669 [Ganoderma leucocontextum]|nr:hypothetical protein LXA43DRAFT_1100669 [Ganoderma leucocontextum]